MLLRVKLSSYGTSSKELSDKLNNDLVGVAKWLHDHKLCGKNYRILSV